MSHAALFAFGIGDGVKILATDQHGKVTGCMVEDAGSQYRVVWWNNGERRHEWLYAAEIEAEAAVEHNTGCTCITCRNKVM